MLTLARIEWLSPSWQYSHEHIKTAQAVLAAEQECGFARTERPYTLYWSRTAEYPWIFEKMNRAPIAVLDVGCGLSPFPYFLSMQGYEVYACDKNKDVATQWELLKLKKKDATVHFKIANAIQLPYFEHRFSIVTAIGMLHELTPTEAHSVLHEIERVLFPSGSAMITLNVYLGLVESIRNAWSQAAAHIFVQDAFKHPGLPKFENGVHLLSNQYPERILGIESVGVLGLVLEKEAAHVNGSCKAHGHRTAQTIP